MHYGAFLNLREKKCTVIGGGKVATRKVKQLLRAEARVTVISPTLTPTLAALVEGGHMHHINRPYQHGDLDSSLLAYAATDSRSVNSAVKEEAKQNGILCNIADDPAACDFFTPAVIEHHGVQIAFSTSGRVPTAAKALKDALTADLADGGRRFYDVLQVIDVLLEAPRPRTRPTEHQDLDPT